MKIFQYQKGLGGFGGIQTEVEGVHTFYLIYFIYK